MKAILIPTDQRPRTIEIEDGYEALQSQVGGMIQALPVPERSDATVYINENGKFECVDENGRIIVNPVATMYMKPVLFPSDFIAGPMLLCGFDPSTGENLDVPNELCQTFGLTEA